MKGPKLRLLAILAASTVAVVAAVLLLAHLPLVRAQVFERAAAGLSARFGLDLRADAFSYNLITRRVTLRGARLAATIHPDEPFLAADRIEVRLPLGVFAGRFAIASVSITGGRLTFVRGADGELNLPPGSGVDEPPGPTPVRLAVRGVTIRGLDFSYRDPAAGIAVEAPGIRADLEYHLIRVFEGVSGAFGIDGGVTVTVGGRTLRAAPVDARLAFDGSDVSLQDVTLRTDEATLAVNGRVLRVLDDPRFDLSIAGTADLARAVEWAPDLPVGISGPLAIDGTLTEAVDAFVLAAHVNSSALAIGDEDGLSIDGDVRLTLDEVSSRGLTLTTAGGGTIEAQLLQPFADGPASYAATWSALDPRVLYRLSGAEPGPLGARIEGSADVRLSPASEVASATITNRATAAPGRGLVPIAGTLDARVSDGRWRAEHRHRSGGTSVSGVAEGVFDAAAPAASTLGGHADVAVGDLVELARLTAVFGMPLPDVVAQGHGPLSAHATLGGRLDDPRVSATVTGTGITLDAVGDDIRIDAGVEASRHAVDVAALSVDVGRARLRGDVHVNMDADALGGTLRLDAPAAADFQAAVPEGYRLEGPLQATAQLGGSPTNPAIDIAVDGAGLSFAGQPVDQLSARARVEGTRVALTSLRLTEGGGALTGTAAYDWESGRYEADLSGKALTWDGIVLEGETTRATVDVAFTGAGTIDDPRGDGVVRFELVGGSFEDLVQRGTVNVSLEGPIARLSGDVPQLGAALTGSIGTRAPYRYDMTATLDALELGPVATLGGLREGEVDGTVSLTASATGAASDTADAAVHVDLGGLDALVGGLPVVLVRPASLDWTPETLTVENLELSVGEGRLSATGVVGADTGRPLTASFDGDLSELARMGRALGAPGALDFDGHLAAHWESTTGIDTARATLRVTGGRLSWVNVPPVEGLAIDATFDGTALTVATLTGTWQGGGIDGTATIPRALLTGGGAGTSADAGQAHLRVTGLSEAALAPWVDEQTLRRISGRVSATLDADIRGTSLEAVDARVTFDEAAFTLAGVEARPARPARLSLANGVLTLDDAEWNVGGRPIRFTGTVDLAAGDEPALDLAASGTADLRLLAAFLPDATTGGRADLDVRVGGTTGAPTVNGRITLQDAEFAIRDPRFAITGLSGPITLSGTRVGFGGLSGTANGGSIRFDGALTLEGGVPTGGQLITELRRVALEYPEGLRSEADGLLTLAPEADGGWLLTGDVRIERSSYRENLSLAALAAANRTETRTVGERSALETLRLNIFVVTVQDALVDNNYGRFEGNVAVRVVGTAARPGLTGRLSLQEGGQVYLAGNTMQIERGTISFVDPTRIEPDLDLQLTTRSGRDDITLSLSGTPDQLTVDVQNTTQPTMPDEEIYQILLGGSGGISGGQAATILSSELLGSTGRAVGLDSLRVERGFSQANVRADPGRLATEADPSTRLTLSKRLRPDVEVTLSQSLRNSGDLSAIVAYRPRRSIELRGVTLGSGERLVDIRHEFTFGGGGVPAAADEPELRVATVTISGEPGEAEAALRPLLGLEPGDRFNFFDWQRDIDALRRHFWDAGYLEARAGASREEDEAAGTVALDYEITRGPLATVAIVGYLAPDSLLEELEEAWTRTIFDQFLLGDFEARVARHLVQEDVIGSTVTAAVADETAERKVIRVTVVAGTSVDRRELRFSGNQAVDAGRLETVVDRAGLGAEAWLEPGTIADAVQRFYRSTGYLTAEVSAADAPRVEGTVGVLPITVVEGPRFVLGDVSLDGVADGREQVARDALGLKAGDQYDAGGIEEGARRVERAYRSRGFNTVRVAVRSEIDEVAGTVRVVYAVQEGLQQILREVTTSGATKTRDGVVADALRLEPGDPVNLTEWAQARRRLYDTNVFRQVDIEAQPLTPDADTPEGVEPVRAVVTVEEYPTWRFRYGLQLSDEKVDESDDVTTRAQSLGVTGELQNQNLLGRAIGAGISGRYERDSWTARTFVQTPTFLGLPASTTLYGEVASEDLRVDDLIQFVTDRRTIATEQRWQRGRGLQVSYGYRFERSRTFDPAPAPDDPFPLDITVDIARVNAAFLADRRNDPFNPSGGWFFSATWDQAAEALGSDYRNAKFAVQEYYFRKFGPVVFASRAGFGGSFWADETLLPQERFYTGGGTTVRGYGENALGPRDFLGQASGGKALMLFNQELRFPIAWWFHGVGFVDAGNVFADNADLSLGDLEWGYGLGLRVNTPFALVRVDFGIPGSELATITSRRANALSSGRWYVGIGHIF